MYRDLKRSELNKVADTNPNHQKSAKSSKFHRKIIKKIIIAGVTAIAFIYYAVSALRQFYEFAIFIDESSGREDLNVRK